MGECIKTGRLGCELLDMTRLGRGIVRYSELSQDQIVCTQAFVSDVWMTDCI
jgi:hypothetical protein